VTVSGSATSASFPDLSPGVYDFDVTVMFSVSNASVAATGSNNVRIVDDRSAIRGGCRAHVGLLPVCCSSRPR
jgi:hypothetical protein